MKQLTLGAFSISLNVKDIQASRQFYENLGFSVFGGNIDQNWLIMKNGNALIGLFQGMFQGNMLTFNPGWDENAKNIENFDETRTNFQKLYLEMYPPTFMVIAQNQYLVYDCCAAW